MPFHLRQMGMIAFIVLVTSPVQGSAALTNTECKECHYDSEVSAKRFESSVHGELDCTDCHFEVPGQHPETQEVGAVAPCVECHDDAAMSLKGSEHWAPGTDGKSHRVDCTDCHSGTPHYFLPPSSRDSPLNSRNVHKICAKCHNNPSKPSENPITGDVFVPVASYLESVHGSKLDKVPGVASCTDCHGHHSFRRIMDPASTLSRSHIIETCGNCHQGKRDDYYSGVHGSLLTEESAKIARMSPEEYAAFIRETPLNERPPVCTSCHTSHSIQPADSFATVDEVEHLCGQCHQEQVKLLDQSVHGPSPDGHGGKRKGLKCRQCHADYHANKDIRSGDSVVSKRNVADVCAACHSDPVSVVSTGHTFEPVSSYKESVHGKGLYQSGLYFSAGCVDCHGSHNIFALEDERSTLHHHRLPETCGNANCHVGVHDKFLEGVHGKIYLEEGARFDKLPPEQRRDFLFKGPVCIDCHVSHRIRRTDRPEFYVQAIRQCGDCHPLAIATYKKSYHGKAALLGSTDVAKCQDCHGSHLNTNATGPDSQLTSDRILAICQKCHKKATMKMVSYINHLEIEKRTLKSGVVAGDPLQRQKQTGLKVLLAFRFLMELLLLSVFVFFGIHTILWFVRGMVERLRHPETVPLEKKTEYYVRIDRFHRIIHLCVVVSFLGLAITGLPIKYPDHPWSAAMFQAFATLFQGNGGQVARVFHRLFAIITFGYLAAHVGRIIATFLGTLHAETMARFRQCPVDTTLPLELRTAGWYFRWFLWGVPVAVAYVPVNLHLQLAGLFSSRKAWKTKLQALFGPNTMLPRLKDFKDLWANIKWFLWLGPRPRWDQWTYFEKFDYWAVFWGVAIIGLSGLCMWFKEFFTSTLGLPGWVINVAMEIHSHEALLAMGFIFSIHFFNGHLRPGKFPMDRVIFMGVVNRHELETERPEQFQRLVQSGKLQEIRAPSPPLWIRVAGTLFGMVALSVGLIIVIWIFDMELGNLLSSN